MMSVQDYTAEDLGTSIQEYSQQWHQKVSLGIFPNSKFWMKTTLVLIWQSTKEEHTKGMIQRRNWLIHLGGAFKLMDMEVRTQWVQYLKKARQGHIYLPASQRVQRISDYMRVIISSRLHYINFWWGFKRSFGHVVLFIWIHILWIYLKTWKKYLPCFRFNWFRFQLGHLRN